MDPNLERVDEHLDAWDDLTEQEQRFIEDSARLRERERAAWARYFRTMAERAAQVDAEAEAIMKEMGW